MQYTTAWTSDGLLIGTLLDRHVNDELPDAQYVPGGKHGEQSVMMGDDWMSAGSISDLGNGQAVWFAPGGDRVMAFKLRGFNNLTRQSGSIDVNSPPKAASVYGDGLKAEYFSSVDLSGQPVVSRIDPRLWFSDSTTGGQMVAAWTEDGPCPGIAAGKPFSARWTGSITAPYSEPFWFRIFNARPGTGHTPIQQAWQEGKGFVRVWLNNQLVLDKSDGSPATNPWQTPPLMHTYGAPPPRLAVSMPNYGQALSFPSDRESVNSESRLELGDYSVSFCFRTTQPTTGICMVGSASYFLKDGTFQVIHSGWPSSQLAGANLADDKWHHGAFVWHSEPRQQKLFIDGQLIATNAGPGGNTGLTGTITLGRANSGGSFKDGSLDEFRVYSRHLTVEEVSQLSKWRR